MRGGGWRDDTGVCGRVERCGLAAACAGDGLERRWICFGRLGRDGADRGAGSVASQHGAADDLGDRPRWVDADGDAGKLVGIADLVRVSVGSLRELRR